MKLASISRVVFPAFVLAGFAVACTRPNASHCANRDGDQTCVGLYPQRPKCSLCTAAFEGCVTEDALAKAEASCDFVTASDTLAGTTTANSDSIGSASLETTGGPSSTTANDSVSGDTTTDTDPTESSSSGGAEPFCGDMMIDQGERCDGTDLGGASCASEGLGEGMLACDGDCRFATGDCENQPICGDDLIQGNETCEGENLEGASCETVGLISGTLACDPDSCEFDTAACLTCGNDVIDAKEQCDGEDLGTLDCTDFAFAGGVLACTSDCTYTTDGCNSCGNNEIDVNEECDGAALGMNDCTTLGYEEGTLMCSDLCLYDLSACEADGNCGNGVINGEEQCDEGDLDDQTCQTYSGAYGGGVLTCADNCSFIDDGCCLDLLQGCSDDSDCCSNNCGVLTLALVCL
ncbi:MAG: hypothetical protein IAG13_24515 [Deltaproteobacteria bacterium]|nr:hypothetical protein [Nannocystaceae bacterium]